MGVALKRASHQLLDKPPVFVDPLALQIVGPRARKALDINPHRFERRFFGAALRAHLAARSRLAEDSLAASVARGIRQYVVLGAGFDTFSMRNTDASLKVFEVDHPNTQQWKREKIAESKLTVPATATLVPMNFVTQDVGTELAKAGFSATSGAFFSWLGVVPYLEEHAVWSTLKWVASVCGPNGGIVFDYTVPMTGWNIAGRFLIWLFKRRLARAGEPLRSSFEPAALVRGLEELGFVVEDLDRDALNARYFAGRTDRLRLRGPGHIVVARMPAPSM